MILLQLYPEDLRDLATGRTLERNGVVLYTTQRGSIADMLNKHSDYVSCGFSATFQTTAGEVTLRCTRKRGHEHLTHRDETYDGGRRAQFSATGFFVEGAEEFNAR